MSHNNHSQSQSTDNPNSNAHTPTTRQGTPYVPKVVREFHHLLATATSRREANPHRRLRRIKLAGRLAGMMDWHVAALTQCYGNGNATGQPHPIPVHASRKDSR